MDRVCCLQVSISFYIQNWKLKVIGINCRFWAWLNSFISVQIVLPAQFIILLSACVCGQLVMY